MAKVLMDEFHLQVFVPKRLDSTEAQAVFRTLNSKRFRTALNQTVRDFFGRYRSLAKTEIKIVA